MLAFIHPCNLVGEMSPRNDIKEISVSNIISPYYLCYMITSSEISISSLLLTSLHTSPEHLLGFDKVIVFISTPDFN